MYNKQLIQNLRNVFMFNNRKEYKENLYNHIVDKSWWSDTKITSNYERMDFLYEEFFKYYDIVANGEVKETEVEGKEFELRYRLINICKMQLDVELARVNRKEYERDED